MPATQSRRPLSELARQGNEVFQRKVRSVLRPEDDGKFVAIDVESDEYEINEDDYAAVARLRSRKPSADIWLVRAGFPTTCQVGAIG